MTLAFGSYASLSGTFAARPAADADQVGRFYFATDTNDLYRDNGAAWQHIGTARTYKVYTALLTQTGTNAPVATVLENTLDGEIVWSRFDVGIYRGTLVGAFDPNKTIHTSYLATTSGISNGIAGEIDTVDLDNIDISTVIISSGVGIDGELSKTPIEIRVYP